jgi:hypothetical protein
MQKTRQSASNFGMIFQYKCVYHISWMPFSSKMSPTRIVDGIPDDMDHYGLLHFLPLLLD